jgi:hypothetical protein
MTTIIDPNLIIDAQFNGPDHSGNGGYCCGRIASYLKPDNTQAVEATLRTPPPLDKPLTVKKHEGAIEVFDDETLIGSAKLSTLDLDIPEPVSLQEAKQAAEQYVGFTKHPFPHCFVCGPKRKQEDGLLIFPGKVADREIVAAPWEPFSALADRDDTINTEHIWAALDCPSFFGAIINTPSVTAVLGRQTLQVYQPTMAADQQYVITAWPMGIDGRKMSAGTAIFSEHGECLAAAKALWITL